MPEFPIFTPSSLADEATALVKAAASYLDAGPISWDRATQEHLVLLPSIPLTIRLCALRGYLDSLREDLIVATIDHLMREVSQEGYSGRHGTTGGYTAGCRGLLCRRANREGVRKFAGTQPSAKYAIADALLDEAESRILPETIVDQVKFSDRRAVSR